MLSQPGGTLVGEQKLFRIEKMMGLGRAQVQPAAESHMPAEPPKSEAKPVLVAPDGTGLGLSLEELAALRDRVSEATRLQAELAELSTAIEKTKQELSAIHYEGPAAARFEAAGSELDAVVKATESATESILGAAERIETLAGNLSAAAADDAARGQAEEIAEQVIGIFEACNFQDITGQRITKVVRTLQFIEERVHGMMEIWGGPSALANFVPDNANEPPAVEEDENALLNGPALEEADGVATQDDIDALFA